MQDIKRDYQNSFLPIPYNLKIAEALYKSTYLESWGSGAKRIMDACREQGVEDPTWRWDGGFVIVTFKRPTRNITPKETTKSNDKKATYKQAITTKKPKKIPKKPKNFPKKFCHKGTTKKGAWVHGKFSNFIQIHKLFCELEILY